VWERIREQWMGEFGERVWGLKRYVGAVGFGLVAGGWLSIVWLAVEHVQARNSIFPLCCNMEGVL
jgi:hypothetical protein